MRYLLVILCVLFMVSCDSGKTEKKMTAKDASKELCDGCKKIYDEAKKSGAKEMPVNKIVEFNKSITEKYAEQFKDPNFKKEFDAENENCKKELNDLIKDFGK